MEGENRELFRGFPALSEVLAEPSLRVLVMRASRRMIGAEAVIALLGLGSMTLGGCMPPVRSNFEDARLAPDLYGGDASLETPSSEPNMSVPERLESSAEPCEVIAPLSGE